MQRSRRVLSVVMYSRITKNQFKNQNNIINRKNKLKNSCINVYTRRLHGCTTYSLIIHAEVKKGAMVMYSCSTRKACTVKFEYQVSLVLRMLSTLCWICEKILLTQNRANTLECARTRRRTSKRSEPAMPWRTGLTGVEQRTAKT